MAADRRSQRHGDAITTLATRSGESCAKAVRAAGSSAKLLGWGGSHLGLDAIKSGAVDGTVCASPGKIGSAGFDALYAAVAKTNTAKARFVEVATPPITKANLASCPPQW